MTTFILVHGGFHGGWCWNQLSPHLRRAGHSVLAPDLPGHGDDRTPQNQATLAMAAAKIGELVARELNPVVLAGHSLGGLIISQVAERYPDRIKTLVWIAGFLVPTGASLQSYMESNQHLGHSNVLPNAALSDDGTHVTFRREKARETFYNTTPPEVAEVAARRLGPTALDYLAAPVSLSHANFERVPRAYVVCLQDRALPTALQRQMIAERPCQHAFELNSDHSPFLSAPAQLAEYLLRLA